MSLAEKFLALKKKKHILLHLSVSHINIFPSPKEIQQLYI